MSDVKTEGKVINLSERVTVTATDKAKYHTKGEKVRCAPAVAEKMKKMGWAV